MKKIIFLAIFLVHASSGITIAQDRIDRLILNKQYPEALALTERMLKDEPDAALFHKKGVILRETFDYTGSMNAFNQAVVFDQNNLLYLTDLADLMATLGNTVDAIQVYRKAVSIGPSETTVRAKLGQLLITQREFQEAYYLFKDLRQSDTTNLFFTRNLAIAAGRSGKSQEAIDLFEQVLVINPRDLSSYVNLAGIYFQLEMFTRANQTLRTGLIQFPGNPQLLLRLAQNLYQRRNFEEALPVYGEYIAGNTPSFEVRKEYGIILYFNKQEEKAMEILEQALMEAPSDPFVALYIGLCLKKLKDYEMSKQYLNLAIESSTPYYLGDIYHHLGQVYGLMREFDQSVEMLTKAYELDPGKHELLFEIATTYEEYNSNKTLALNYYQIYLTEAREKALNANYALDRIRRIKEDMFFGE
jgi:tetratricopeptide (TPR) repeat protein